MGGGGALFDPQISPFDSALFVVACDMSGLYLSRDAGDSWKLLDTRSVEGSIRFSVAFDPTHDGRVVAFHRVLGLRVSDDWGATWHAYEPAFPQADPSGDPLVVTAAAFSPDGRLLVGTSIGPYRYERGAWTLRLPDPDGGTHDVQDSTGRKVATVNDNDVVRFAFASEADGVIDLVATINRLYRWNRSTREWDLFDPGDASSRPAGPRDGILNTDVQPPTYVASRIRGLAAATNGSSYAVYVALMTEAADIGNVGGIYRFDSRSGRWTRETTGLDLEPGDGSAFIDAPRYEDLTMAEGQTEIVYASAVPTGYVPNVYRRDSGGLWTGIYSGYPKRADANVDTGWFEFPRPEGFSWGFGGAAHGLIADPRNGDRVLYTNEAAVYFTDRATTAALPSAPRNPKHWRQRFTRLAAGVAGGGNDRWQTTGLDVTTVWNYDIDPADPSVHMLCCADVGLQRSDDAGHSWRSIGTSDLGTPAEAEWHNFYELTHDRPFTRWWAAVATQHDIPHDAQLDRRPETGTVLTSVDGKAWSALAAPGLAPGPVVSVLYDDETATLYAAVWGSGVYMVNPKAADPAWRPAGTGLPASPFCHQLRRAPGGELYCAVAADRRSGIAKAGGLYVLSEHEWQDATANLSVTGTLAPMDFDFHPTSGAVYLCTACIVGGGGGGGLYKSTGGSGTAMSWTELPVSSGAQPWASPYPVYFKPHFDRGFLYVTSTTHGIRFSADEVNWYEYPALDFLSTQRMRSNFEAGSSDASFLITTFGGSAWRVERSAYFIDARSAFSRCDVDAAPTDSGTATKTFPESIHVVFDGFLPEELGLPSAPLPSLALHNRLTAQPPAGLALVNPRFLPEDPTLAPDRIQRFAFAYDLQFSEVAGSYLADFDQAREQDNFIDLTATMGSVSASSSIKLCFDPDQVRCR